MDPNDISTGLLIVAACFLCVSIGATIKTQTSMIRLQAELLQATAELGKAFAALAGQIVGSRGGLTNIADSWRELPPEARAELRHIMRQVLSDMDKEMN